MDDCGCPQGTCLRQSDSDRNCRLKYGFYHGAEGVFVASRHQPNQPISNFKFIGWKLLELVLYVVAFPFLFIGCWMERASDWCRDRAFPHQPS